MVEGNDIERTTHPEIKKRHIENRGALTQHESQDGVGNSLVRTDDVALMIFPRIALPLEEPFVRFRSLSSIQQFQPLV